MDLIFGDKVNMAAQLICNLLIDTSCERQSKIVPNRALKKNTHKKKKKKKKKKTQTNTHTHTRARTREGNHICIRKDNPPRINLKDDQHCGFETYR